MTEEHTDELVRGAVQALSVLLADERAREEEAAQAVRTARGALIRAQEAHRDQGQRVRRIRRAIETLAVPKNPIGRPRGGDPKGVNTQVRRIVHRGGTWSGAAIRTELKIRGVDVPANRVSAALNRLAELGSVERIGPRLWQKVETQ